MPPGPARDRLAIWTFESYGEQVPAGNPGVTDRERAAAGRETIADRWRALLPANRDHAASQYRASGLPDGQDVVRVWRQRDSAALRARLGGEPLATWAEGDILHVLWQGAAGQVQLAGGVQMRLWPVEGAAGLWEGSLRIRCLDEAVISVIAVPVPAGGDRPSRPPDTLVWRGPRAPSVATASALAGSFAEHTIESAALRAPRRVTVYRPPCPPAPPGPMPGCVLADGQSTRGFAEILEHAILAGAAPPVLLVGVDNAADQAGPWPDRRAQEYLPGHGRAHFNAHLEFVTGEVIPWAASQSGGSQPWTAAGFSNGGAWAIAAAQRRPDVFGAVAAFSAGVVPRQITRGARMARVRHYLAAGMLEPGFRRATRQWAQRLQRAGLPCRYQEWAGGHDDFWWKQQLPAALAWLLSPGDSVDPCSDG